VQEGGGGKEGRVRSLLILGMWRVSFFSLDSVPLILKLEGVEAVEPIRADTADHILLLQTSLMHYEYILSHCQPAYLSHLQVSFHITRGGIAKHILALSVVTISILPMQFVTSKSPLLPLLSPLPSRFFRPALASSRPACLPPYLRSGNENQLTPRPTRDQHPCSARWRRRPSRREWRSSRIHHLRRDHCHCICDCMYHGGAGEVVEMGSEAEVCGKKGGGGTFCVGWVLGLEVGDLRVV
jgi:hypothetical protein